MNKPLKYEEVSDDLQEIINHRPAWIIRSGNTVFLIILLLLTSLCFFIRYPETVNTSVRIVAEQTPKMIKAKREARLEKIFVQPRQAVQKGDPLALLSGTADYSGIMRLREWLTQTQSAAEKGKMDALITDPPPVLTNLGELQPAYQEFQNNVNNILQLGGEGYYQQKKMALQKDIQYQSALQTHITNQKKLEQQNYELQKKEHDAMAKLAEEKVIAPMELNQDKSKLIARQQALEQLSSQLVNSEASRHNKGKELLELEKFMTDQQQVFRSAVFTLKSRLDEWLEQNLLVAPENGTVEFISYLQENQLINAGQDLFYVQTKSDGYFAEMRAGQNKLGNIHTGQEVQIRLESFPSAEFGFIKGVINDIGEMPNQRDSFLIRVILPQGLATNTGKKISFRNNLLGSGEIVIANRRLIERLFSVLRK